MPSRTKTYRMVPVTPEIHGDFKVFAAEQDRPMVALATIALREYIERNQKPEATQESRITS